MREHQKITFAEMRAAASASGDPWMPDYRWILFGTLKIANLILPILIVPFNVAGNSSMCGLTSLHGPLSIFSPLNVRFP
jgi:hypothetical protein